MLINIYIPIKYKETDNNNAILFKMPLEQYLLRDYKFWYPKQFIKEVLGGYELKVHDTFAFRLEKKNDYFEVLDTAQMPAKKMQQVWVELQNTPNIWMELNND